MSGPLILFVCTGNICRSPMAEGLFRARLAPDSQWSVTSSGIMAAPGLPASLEAIAAAQQYGADLRTHRSRPLDQAQVDAATVIVVMTNTHRDQVQALFPGAAQKVFLLNAFSEERTGLDVEDPIGLPSATYNRICAEIAEALPGLTAFLRELET